MQSVDIGFIEFFSVKEQLPTTSAPNYALVEMMTIKKCVQQIGGLSEYTVCQIVIRKS